MNLENKQNIVIVHENGNITGGSAKVAIQTAIGLAREGFKVTYFCATNPIDEELKNTVDKIICLNQPEIKNASKLKGAIQGIWNKKAYKQLNALLKKHGRQTVVHIHGWSHALSASIFKACADNQVIPFVTLHDYFSVCPNGGFYNFKEQCICHLKPMSFKCICNNCDTRSYSQKIYRVIRQYVQDKYIKNNSNINYIYISEFSFSKVKVYLKSDKVYYLHNPVDYYEIDKVDALSNDKYLYIGRVAPEKGVDLFCEALTKLKRNGIVIGDGPSKDILSKKYPNIDFVGWKSKQDIIPYLKQAKCLIFPSRWYEGAPLTTEECLNVGIPCIVSDACAAVDQIADGVNGYTFKSEDVDDLANKISIIDDTMVLFKIDKGGLESYSLTSYINNLVSIFNSY